MEANIVRINPAGSLAKLLLMSEEEGKLQVDLPFERFRDLNLLTGEAVYLRAARASIRYW